MLHSRRSFQPLLFNWARCISSGKDLLFSDEARFRMSRGVNILADAVSATLGPRGRNVLIEQDLGAPIITKDGVTVAKSIEFQDKFENIGAQLVIKVANKTNDIAGDGTTTATILSRSIFMGGCKCVAAGLNPMDLRRGINMAVDKVVENLEAISQYIMSEDEVKQVAMISANNEKDIGSLISMAMMEVGRDGIVTVEDGNTLTDELKVVEGMDFDRGFVSSQFISNEELETCEFDNPYILFCNSTISEVLDIYPALSLAIENSSPLVIIAEDVNEDALQTLLLNKTQNDVEVCAIKAPNYGRQRKELLKDIAAVTGGHVFNSSASSSKLRASFGIDESELELEMEEEDNTTLESAGIEHLGRCKKISIGRKKTIIIGGTGDDFSCFFLNLSTAN